MQKLLIPFCLALLLLFPPLNAMETDDARTLKFFHTHTGQSLEVNYYQNGLYLLEPMEELRDFLADWRNGEKKGN